MKLRKILTCFLVAIFCLSFFPKKIKAATIDVDTEEKLRAAVIGAAVGDVINLTADIYLADPSEIFIAVGQDITITSGHATGSDPYKLIGHNGCYTIRVGGTLTIDGIVVTHRATETGGGIYMRPNGVLTGPEGSNGTLNFISGEITGNHNFVDGGGINNEYGTLNMTGGEIYDNSSSMGGGVSIASHALFYMSDGLISENSADYGGGVLVYIGSFNMTGGSITGNKANDFGGGVCVFGYDNRGLFKMDGGTVEENTSKDTGGGVFISGTSRFHFINGVITKNIAANFSGGVGIHGSTLTMEGGQVVANRASDGGGLLLTNSSTGVISGGSITSNQADDWGGGILVLSGSSINLSNMQVSSNTAGGNGAGIYLVANGTLTTGSNVSIIGNKTSGDGGGVYTALSTYANISTSSDTEFSQNTAIAAYAPPSDISIYPNISYKNTSIDTHPLNNYDINWLNTDPANITLTYQSNGGVGGPLVDTVSVLVRSFIIKSPSDVGVTFNGYSFAGWNTEADGSGTTYSPGDVMSEVPGNMNVYAMWTPLGQNPNTGDINTIYNDNFLTFSFNLNSN